MIGYIILTLIILLQAAAGGRLARNRGRNTLWWSLLSALFPIFIMIIYFEKPLKEVPGGFKNCPTCREFISWQATNCKYCAAQLPPPPCP
jgi:hypothetical protein